jgi:uncharacterized membrane protein YjgN (DUF898 family)
MESNCDPELRFNLQKFIADNLLRFNSLVAYSNEVNFSFNSANYGQVFLELLLKSNNSMSSAIINPIISDNIEIKTTLKSQN